MAQRHAVCLSWMHDSLCSSRFVPSQNACGSLLRVQKLQTASGHQPACARRMHDLLGPLQVGTAAPQAPAAPQAAAAGGSDKPPSLMIFVTRMFEKIGLEPEHVKQRAQVDLLILQSALLLPTALASTAGRTDCAVHVAPAEGAQFLGCFPHVLKAACLSTMLLCVSAMLNTKLLQLKLREMIEDATSKGELWTRQWDKVLWGEVLAECCMTVVPWQHLQGVHCIRSASWALRTSAGWCRPSHARQQTQPLPQYALWFMAPWWAAKKAANSHVSRGFN